MLAEKMDVEAMILDAKRLGEQIAELMKIPDNFEINYFLLFFFCLLFEDFLFI
jgi:hypothetical protein